jgi:hypothetical protein
MSGQPGSSPRRRLDPYHIAFARARRPRTGWQTLAQMLGVNAEDLRRACEDTAVYSAPEPEAPIFVHPPKPTPKDRQRPRSVQAGTMEAAVLAALAGGARRRVRPLAWGAGLTEKQTRSLLVTLTTKGMVEGRGEVGWRLTAAGKAALAGFGGGHG